MAGTKNYTIPALTNTNNDTPLFPIPRIPEISIEIKAFQVPGSIYAKQDGENVVINLLLKHTTAN